jgi:hypothetical protein
LPARLSEEEYDRRLAVFGKAQRLEPYQTTQVKILHKCLIHGEELIGRPGDLLNGHGLGCCSLNKPMNRAAKSRYDKKLQEIGLAVRLDEYQSRRKSILHRCTLHGTKFLMEPRRALEGRLPPCCSKLGRGSIYFMLLAPDRWKRSGNCEVYIFTLKRFPGFVKIGVSQRTRERSEDQEYGDFVCSWRRSNRFEAYLIEQAALRDLSLEKVCPCELEEGRWAGWTEVRKAKSHQAVKLVQFYADQMDALGVHRFILKYLEPSRAEADLCLEALKNE